MDQNKIVSINWCQGSNINQLLLLSGQDIAFNSAKCTIHQPRINEISMIGERAFHTGSNFLAVNKNSLNLQDTTGLEEIDNFNIFMAVMNNPSSGEYRINSYFLWVTSFLYCKLWLKEI